MSKARILYVEDDPDTSAMLVMYLQRCGYEVVCSADSTQALTLANEQDFDLLLFDNWMPDVSGIDLTVQVRQFNNVTPILFYSGAVLKTDEEEALIAGAQAYLGKPDGINELVQEIDKLIAKSKTASC
jgi:DNA-binding response OmpR family regulator